MGAALLTLSSCGQVKNSEDAQTNIVSRTAEPDGSTGEVQKTQNDNIAGSDLAELENLIGEYEYLSDYGTGKLMIQRSSNGYDISDYESESSCPSEFFACPHDESVNRAAPIIIAITAFSITDFPFKCQPLSKMRCTTSAILL